MSEALYPLLVWLHLLLFTFWLAGDIGGFLLARHLCKHPAQSLETRRPLLGMMAALDVGPAIALALMVPSALLLLVVGRWWPHMPDWLLAGGTGLGIVWLALLWEAHRHPATPRATRARAVKAVLRWGLAGFFLALGALSLRNGGQPIPPFLGGKALLFGLILVVTSLIDLRRPTARLSQAASGATEAPERAAMDRARLFRLAVPALLLLASYIGVAKPGL